MTKTEYSPMTQEIIDWFKQVPETQKYILNLTPTKESIITLLILVTAIGADRVVAVIMPEDEQEQIQPCVKLCDDLGVQYTLLNIRGMTNTSYSALNSVGLSANDPKIQRICAARARGTLLMEVGVSLGAEIVDSTDVTLNLLNEANDELMGVPFAVRPIRHLTTEQVYDVGIELGLSEDTFQRSFILDQETGCTSEDFVAFVQKNEDHVYAPGVKFWIQSRLEKMYGVTE